MKDNMWELLMATSGHLYPMKRKDGIYLYEPEETVSCLLCYRRGKLVGTLNHFNIDFPEYDEKKGNVFVVVKPSYRGKDIATELVNRGVVQFNINFGQQTYTDSGKEFYEKYKLNLKIKHLT